MYNKYASLCIVVKLTKRMYYTNKFYAIETLV